MFAGNQTNESKQALTDIFLNSVYVYDDKILIILNYKDGETCVTFDDVRRLACEPHEAINSKENPNNTKDCQSSPIKCVENAGGSRSETLHSPNDKSLRFAETL